MTPESAFTTGKIIHPWLNQMRLNICNHFARFELEKPVASLNDSHLDFPTENTLKDSQQYS